jgi:thiamine-phosphate diphosphorylase
MKKRNINFKNFNPQVLKLYLVTGLKKEENLFEIVKKALAGGVSLVQLRDKKITDKDFIRLGEKLHKLTQASSVPLIINDRVHLLKKINAEGVHIGQDDMNPAKARKIIGPRKILGVSAKTISKINKAKIQGADYIGVGPVFKTSTKADAGPSLGLKALKKINKLSPLPVVAIGGINKTNAPKVIRSGVKNIAVVSAIINSPDPEKAAKNLLAIIKGDKN